MCLNEKLLIKTEFYKIYDKAITVSLTACYRMMESCFFQEIGGQCQCCQFYFLLAFWSLNVVLYFLV